MVLEVRGLKKLYRNHRGVSEMTFSLDQGDIFGLLGANGSGKTTAMKCICGLCPYEGDVSIFDEPVRDNTQNALKYVGCVVEAPAFYGYLSAEKNLRLAARYYGLPADETADAISRTLGNVGLAHVKNDRVDKFSLGMKARMGLALCMFSQPRFMVLDEPLNGLDIEGMVDIRNIILDLARSTGAAFLISSHLAAEIEKTCTRVGVMYEGALLETARMADVLRDYASVEAYYIATLGRMRGVTEIPV
ncbi:MAG: ATP-binding cassette domain-containing protein [Clostridiales bacterium]|jgi:ABC-2 type transport system ATP-binding protein|nr:ATP-binding cassette domain-containing protein [Clostridiales bacterium]